MSNEIQTNVLTPEVTKAELVVALSKEGLAYQTLLQECENVKFTKDNLNEDRSCLTNLRKVKSNLEKMENPHTAKWKAWNEARKSLVDPVSETLNRKVNEYKVLAEAVAEENRKAEAEKQRKAGILAEIDSFFINQSQAIAAATEPSELVRIEKLIGSHKGNSSRYQEYLPQMAQKAEILAQLIKTQKYAIKKIADLRAKETLAEASGDDEAILNLREQQEAITANIEQGKINVQESAISMATKVDVIEPEVVFSIAPKARRSSWVWNMVNEKEATKRGWTTVQANKEKIDEFLKQKREEGVDSEFTEGGIHFFIQKTY